jgi:hypothetical protein
MIGKVIHNAAQFQVSEQKEDDSDQDGRQAEQKEQRGQCRHAKALMLNAESCQCVTEWNVLDHLQTFSQI